MPKPNDPPNPPVDPPKTWTPKDPLPDDDDEAETNRKAQAEARRDYLRGQHMKTLEEDSDDDKAKKKKKKSSLW